MELRKDHDFIIDYHQGKANIVAYAFNRKATRFLAYVHFI